MVGARRARALLAVCLAATWPGFVQSQEARKLCWKEPGDWTLRVEGRPWGLKWDNPTCIDVCPAAEGLGESYASSVLLGEKVRTKLDRGSPGSPVAENVDCVYPVTQEPDGPGEGLWRSRGTAESLCHYYLQPQSVGWSCNGGTCAEDALCECCPDSLCPLVYPELNPTRRLMQFQVWWDFTTSDDACGGSTKVITPTPLFAAGVEIETQGDKSCSWIVKCHPGTSPKLTVTESVPYAPGYPTTVSGEGLGESRLAACSFDGSACPEPLTSTGDMTVTVPSDASLIARATCEGEPTNILPDLPDNWAPFQWLAWDTATDALVIPDTATTLPAATSGAACRGEQVNECRRGMLAPYSVTEYDTNLEAGTNIFIPNDWATANLPDGSNTDQQRYYPTCLNGGACVNADPQDGGFSCNCDTENTGHLGERCETNVGFARIAVVDGDAEHHLCAASTSANCVSGSGGVAGNLAQQTAMLGGSATQTVSIKYAGDSSAEAPDLTISTISVSCPANQPGCRGWLDVSEIPTGMSIPRGGQEAVVITYNAAAVSSADIYTATLVIDGTGAEAHIELGLSFVVEASSYVLLALPQGFDAELPAGDTSNRLFQLFNVRTAAATWAIGNCGNLPDWLSIETPMQANACASPASENVAAGSTTELIVGINVPQQVPDAVLTFALDVEATANGATETLTINFQLAVLPLEVPDSTTSTASMLKEQPDGTMVEDTTWTLTAGEAMNVEVAAKDQYGNAITAPGLTFKMHIDQDMDAEVVPTQAWDAEYLSRFEPGTAAAPIEKFRLVAPQVPSRGVFDVRIVYVGGATETEIDAVMMTAQPVACDDLGPMAQANPLGTDCDCLAGYGLLDDECVLCSETTGSDTSNLHSTAGICTACPAGTQPIADETNCVECYDGFASPNGLCTMCLPGKRPTEGRSRCDFCEAGKEPTPVDGSNLVVTVNGTTCAPCPPNGTRETNDGSGCIACPGSDYQVPNAERSRCVNCPSGTEAANNSACVPCEAGRARFMTDTQGCSQCPASAEAPTDEDGEQVRDQVPNADQSGCELCGDGEEPDESRATCVACPTGKARTATQAGLCQQCEVDDGLIPDANKRQCELCPAGKEPAADGSGCIQCEVGKARAAAATEGCSQCPASAEAPEGENGVQVRDQVPNLDQSGCELCGGGEEPDDSRTICVACAARSVRAADGAGLCQQCDVDDGLIPDENKRECELCPTGREPAANGTACVQCPPGRARDRDHPGRCVQCEDGKAAYPETGDNSAGECRTCDTGKVRQSSRLQDVCVACPTGTQPNVDNSAEQPNTGLPIECTECPGATVNDEEGGLCEPCEAGKQPNLPQKTACETCPPKHAIEPGSSECTLCGTGKYANGQQTMCVQCPNGQQVNATESGCEPCPKGSATNPASPGTCMFCIEDGKSVPNTAQTSCVACPANSHPIANPGTSCGCDAGYFVDPYACKQPADGKCRCADGTQSCLSEDDARAACCMAADGTTYNKDRFDAQGNPIVRRGGNESRTTEPDEMICSPCPQGSKCFADNIVVAHPGKWVDPTGEMIPHAITYQKDAPDQIDETKIRAVACLPLNCPGYCFVAYELEEDFDPTGNAPDCVKSLWKLCSSRDPAIQQNQTLDWTSSLEPWQTAVQECVKYGEQKRGWREKADGNWPPVHNLTEDEIQRYFDDLSVDLVNVIAAANVCRKGSTGRLCSSCLDGYEKVEGTCVSCLKTDYMSMIQPLLVYSLMCVFFMHKSRRVITGRDCDIHNSSCIIGITVFFIQTLTLLKFNFGVSGVQNKLVGVMRMQLDDPEQDDGECLATGNFYVDYAIKYSIQVFMLTFSAIISVACKLKPWQRKMTVFFALQFSLFPINLRSMQIWFCRNDLAKSTEYLYVDPAIRCYDADHYTAYVILSCVIAAFAVVMPYMLYTRMRYSMDAHEKLLKVECYLNFGFKKGKEMIETGVVTDFHSPEYAARDYTSVLYYPLRRQTFWWAIVWLLRPSMIAFVYNGRDPSTGSFFGLADWRVVVLIMLMIYNCVQASIRPFKHSNESQLDAISVLLLMLMFVLNINQDFMGASGADITRVQTLNLFATFILMACVLLATFVSKKATAMQIAKMIARSRWKTAWNSMSSDSSDPLAEVGSLVTEVEKGSEKKRFAKLTQLGIAKKLPIFEQIDVDGSGMISLDEFLEWWTLRTLRTGAGEAMKDVARDLFKRFDVDGSGEVDREEFEQILGGLRAWHEEQKALMAQIEEPIEVRQAEVKAEVGRVIANMQSKGWMLVGTQWTRHADAASQLNPLHDGGASASFEVEGRVQLAASADDAQPAVAATATMETPHYQTHQHEQATTQAPTVEEIFAAIDIDSSGELSFHEFMNWWRGSGGDEMALVKAQEAFRLVELRDGIPGVSLVELKEVMVAVATDTWEEAIDPVSGRKYFVNPATKESSWLVPGIECVQPFLLTAGITQVAARTQHRIQQAAAHPAYAPQAGSSVSRGEDMSGVRDVLAASPGGGHQPTGSALLDGLQQSAVVNTMINQMGSRQTRDIRQSEFTDWWAQHKRPDLPVMQCLTFSRTFNRAFDAQNGTLGVSDVLQVLANMWEEKVDPQSGQLYYVHAASKESAWSFGAAEADAWLQKMVAL